MIKICGVKDPDIAEFAANKGAQLIGIVFAPASSRCVTSQRGKEIAAAAKEAGAEPVAVFVNSSAEEISAICEKTGIGIVQPYGLLEALPEQLRQICVNAPGKPLRSGIDFLLVESESPGSGQKLDWERFVPPAYPEWFLAGGLNLENVEEALQRFDPFGIDVSSGVEREGRKNRGLIEQLIQKVREHE